MLRKPVLTLVAVSLICLVSALLGCTSPLENGAVPAGPADMNAAAGPPTIYTAGMCSDDPAGGACYWKGTSRVDLSGDNASTIYISSGTVYTAGSYDYAGHNYPCYWKNNTRVNLPGGSTSGGSRGLSIFVTGGKVYVVGYHSGNNVQACLWIDDGRSINLIDLQLPLSGHGFSYATSVHVVGTTVYAVGYYYTGTGTSGKKLAFLWTSLGRGGSSRDLSTSFSGANGLVVSAGKAYIAGYYQSGTVMKACYWIWTGNSTGGTISLTKTDLQGDNAEAKAIFLAGGRVYTAGFVNGKFDSDGFDTGAGTACYWNNRRRTGLMSSTSRASSIYVSGGTIYTSGWYYSSSSYAYQACTWTGTNRTDLPDFGGYAWSWGLDIWVN